MSHIGMFLADGFIYTVCGIFITYTVILLIRIFGRPQDVERMKDASFILEFFAGMILVWPVLFPCFLVLYIIVGVGKLFKLDM